MFALMFATVECAAMGSVRQGENATYGIRNIAPEAIEQVRMADADDPGRSYAAGGSRMHGNPTQPIEAYFPHVTLGFGGGRYMSDTGHRVPEAVLITWRQDHAPDAQPYTGEPVGPFRVEVRSRIPTEVLALARKDEYVLGLSFTAGMLPIYFNWRLTISGGSALGRRVICIGGDSFSNDVKEVKLGSPATIVPVWPHCKLP